ncbi:ATP-dependent helicase [Janibacter terrae]|uniref:ATP-dependent helicase n=1 Tax=Janibacter terrae TaxID=103817 RepID=UPI000838FA6F|nr:ATP-dependent DNA helicase [Janibacter terrae]
MTAYTPAQQAAIACLDEPLQIIACAGSGKTQVISQRIVRILEQPGIEPRNVVAFTFTEKAAAELKERVHSIVEKEHGPVTGLAEMYIGTMHGYCLDLLQRLVPQTFKFSVMSDITTRLLIDKYSTKSGLTTCPKLSGDTLKRYTNSRLFMQVTSVLREDDIDADLIPDGVSTSCSDYLRLIYDKSSFDYTEMINLAVQMLDPAEAGEPGVDEVQAHVRDDIRYVIVDEYQDVNPLQEALVQGLVQFGANLCVVGDDDQTIYQWRGSAVSNILTFDDRYDGVRQVTLADNFRSSKGIVELGHSVALRIPEGERLDKRMVAAGHQVWERGDLLALEHEDEDAEAAWICDRMETLLGVPFVDVPGAEPRGLSWSDFAVLYRSVAKDSQPLVAELRKRNIPFVIKGLNKLFESLEITAVVGIFRYMVGEVDATTLRALWDGAHLIGPQSRWADAMAVLDRGRDFDRGERWGVYNIQRLYLDFLEALELREETVPGEPGRGELVFYQLGKFSQAISDFEQIHFSSSPANKYQTFAAWLEYQAPDYYADGDGDVGYATPDAVTLGTVHQAKGMQWPAVFLPCLRRNRFPSKRHGGLNLFHVIPEEAVADPDRYRGTLADETRLFYVAITRAQKYLAVSYSPSSSRMYKARSEFFDHCTENTWVSTKAGMLPTATLPQEPKHEIPQVTLSFSELKYLFECPYQFKLRFLYGFNPPLHEALGFGKGLHDALSEVHKRAIGGDILDKSAAGELVQRHLHTPFAYPALREQLEKAAKSAIERYFVTHGESLASTVHSEKQIQVHVAPGVTIDGRVDLIRRLDTDELAIVDFKSSDRAQAEDVTRDQLHVYAVGYEELTGQTADLIEVLNLDPEGKSTREEVEGGLLVDIRSRIAGAGESLRTNDLPRLPVWCGQCESCDVAALCRRKPGTS